MWSISKLNSNKLLKTDKFTKGAFFHVGLFPESSSGQAVANLLQYKHTASRSDVSIPTRKNA